MERQLEEEEEPPPTFSFLSFVFVIFKRGKLNDLTFFDKVKRMALSLPGLCLSEKKKEKSK